jgi:predicted metal-binding membrane protein
VIFAGDGDDSGGTLLIEPLRTARAYLSVRPPGALTVVVHHLTAADAGAHDAHHYESGMAGTDSMPHVAPAHAELWAGWLWWTVMAAAMMLPIAARGAGRIARAGLWLRRHVAMVEYLSGYLAVWSLVATGAGRRGVGRAAHRRSRRRWCYSSRRAGRSPPVRRRVLRRCRGAGFVNVRGWRADRDCTAVGAADGCRCVFTCGPAMAVTALSHSLILMAALTLLLLLSERSRGPNPAQRAGRPMEALCMAGLAVAAGAWTLSGAGPCGCRPPIRLPTSAVTSRGP